jgi:hypothetical protein
MSEGTLSKTKNRGLQWRWDTACRRAAREADGTRTSVEPWASGGKKTGSKREVPPKNRTQNQQHVKPKPNPEICFWTDRGGPRQPRCGGICTACLRASAGECSEKKLTLGWRACDGNRVKNGARRLQTQQWRRFARKNQTKNPATGNPA